MPIKYKLRKSVSQHLLRRYVELQRAAEQLKEVKAQIIEGLKDGLPCQPGPIKAKLRVRAGSRRPRWKTHYEELATEVYDKDRADMMVEAIIDDTAPGDDSYGVEVFE